MGEKPCRRSKAEYFFSFLDEANGRQSARLRELCKVLYGPFKPYVTKYPQLEGSVLVEEMTALNQDPSKDIVDELRSVGASVAKAR